MNASALSKRAGFIPADSQHAASATAPDLVVSITATSAGRSWSHFSSIAAKPTGWPSAPLLIVVQGAG
jgi:hypothetical protein